MLYSYDGKEHKLRLCLLGSHSPLKKSFMEFIMCTHEMIRHETKDVWRCVNTTCFAFCSFQRSSTYSGENISLLCYLSASTFPPLHSAHQVLACSVPVRLHTIRFLSVLRVLRCPRPLLVFSDICCVTIRSLSWRTLAITRAMPVSKGNTLPPPVYFWGTFLLLLYVSAASISLAAVGTTLGRRSLAEPGKTRSGWH